VESGHGHREDIPTVRALNTGDGQRLGYGHTHQSPEYRGTVNHSINTREEVFMEGPLEPNMGPSLADVLLCTFESTNAGFSSFPLRKLLSWE
jgi:hypothetical protein